MRSLPVLHCTAPVSLARKRYEGLPVCWSDVIRQLVADSGVTTLCAGQQVCKFEAIKQPVVNRQLYFEGTFCARFLMDCTLFLAKVNLLAGDGMHHLMGFCGPDKPRSACWMLSFQPNTSHLCPLRCHHVCSW